ncbi:hypothetical protein [Falsiroseomonas tokyonensis]|uniref:Uncharacterized protein n=1 Tax=Falsiroseomonas tokyonensis TaxID=430521 RepID=A0ABV7BZY0_9PROT|nr:hypothetical protein [Falsiroseomonas tokyonensis]MBU8540816.1 hypothetical protein [Falsiroseomonas tokyonensis]
MIGHTVLRREFGRVGMVLAEKTGAALVSRSYGQPDAAPHVEWVDAQGLIIDAAAGPVPAQALQAGMSTEEKALFAAATEKRQAAAKKGEG